MQEKVVGKSRGAAKEAETRLEDLRCVFWSDGSAGNGTVTGPSQRPVTAMPFPGEHCSE